MNIQNPFTEPDFNSSNFKIPDFLDQDSLLQYIIYGVQNYLLADGCSIFLKEHNSNKFILRESTILSEFIGVDGFNLESSFVKGKLKQINNIGLTFYALYQGTTLNIPDVKKDSKWSGFGKPISSTPNFHCELPPSELTSLLAIPLKKDGEIFGLIRAVSKKVNHFNISKINNIEKLSPLLFDRIFNAVSFSNLISTGASLSLEDLCQKVVEDVRRITKAKGCTIFLRDDNYNQENIFKFSAVASTGLIAENISYSKTKNNLKEAYYEINMSSDISHSFTEYSIKNRKQIVINDVYSEEEIKRYTTLKRKPGQGKISESFSETIRQETRSLMISPIFDRDKNNVIGVIRVNKPRAQLLETDKLSLNIHFTSYERRLFSAYVEQLSKILLNIDFFRIFDKISGFSNKDDLFSFVVKAATKLVGGRGCSILIYNKITDKLDYIDSYGSLKPIIKQLEPYEIGEGWTGWVAKNKIPLKFNSASEFNLLLNYLKTDPPFHSKRINECESGKNHSEKFLAVPILNTNNNLLGVIRVPKVAEDTDFIDSDVQILTTLAKHIGLSIENIENFEASIREREKTLKRKLEEGKALQEISRKMRELVKDEVEFSKNLSTSLQQFCKIIGSSMCAIFYAQKENFALNHEVSILANSEINLNIPTNKKYILDQYLFNQVNEIESIKIVDFCKVKNSDSIFSVFCGSNSFEINNIQSFLIGKSDFGPDHFGFMLVFFSKTNNSSNLNQLEEETGLINQLVLVAGTAWHNFQLYQKVLLEIDLRRKWLRRVIHQILAPLHGIQGYADNLKIKLEKFKKIVESQNKSSVEVFDKFLNDFSRTDKWFETLFYSSHYVARLANNFAWTVYEDDMHENSGIEIVDDFVGFLIGCARDFQGIAREKKVWRVHVNIESVEPFNSHISINKDLFKQAIGNLLDNAVKYSSPGTEIIINGAIENNKLFIEIANHGIQLKEDDILSIFSEGFRTEAAQKVAPTGTGIGLSVAKEIIEIHGGFLKAKPSTITEFGYKTQFVIELPKH
jgi:signal transduction histidine kinase/GAF domain-containing protein